LNFVVLGATGQLGRDLCPRLPGHVTPLSRQDVDLEHVHNWRQTLQQWRADVVINCAAYNFVDRAESEMPAAFSTNTYAVGRLAMACGEMDCSLVHFSSDYVFGFDANRRVPYLETETPGPLSVYGLSKLAGEYLVRAYCPKHFVIRTCGLYGVWGSGGKGGNFVETMLKIAGQGKPLRVVSDQTCAPSYTVDIAEATSVLVRSERFGLYHLTNSGSCSWYEFAKAIFEMAGIGADLTPTTTEEYAAPARRPLYSVLSSRNYESLGLMPLRHWREALGAYLEEKRRKANRSTAAS
jgi:dTDP-4-dehydrorhamnose reductase